MNGRIRAYYQLTKPGIVRGNAVHLVAGALFASMLPLMWEPLLGAVIGTSLVIASACVANNYMDRGIDAKMKRTRRRPAVTGLVAFRDAMIFAAVLGAAGFITLAFLTNPTVVLIGIIAYVLYVFAYGWAKRRTVHSTLIGAIPGALPAMAGYVAISGQADIGAWLVFLLVFIWQMPHFYAISIFRREEYHSAGLPVLGAVRPFETVRRYIVTYMVGYVVIVTLMVIYDVIGASSALLLLAGAGWWLSVATFADRTDHHRWARSVFGVSLVLTLLFLLAAGLNVFVGPPIHTLQ